MKFLVILLFLANIAALAYNGYKIINLPNRVEFQDQVSGDLVTIKKGLGRYQNRIADIQNRKLEKIEDETATSRAKLARDESDWIPTVT